MAYITPNATPAGKAVTAIRDQVDHVLGRISRVRSTVNALRFAAEADRESKPAIYWPDLMKVLDELLPNETDLSDRFRELLQQLETGAGGEPAETASAPAS